MFHYHYTCHYTRNECDKQRITLRWHYHSLAYHSLHPTPQAKPDSEPHVTRPQFRACKPQDERLGFPPWKLTATVTIGC